MHQILVESGIDINDCYFTSLLKCSLPNGVEGTSEQASLCLGYILTELMAIKPKILFVSGRLAFKTLTKIDTKDSIGKLRGMVYKINMPWGEVGVVPTWTPGYAMHKEAAAQDIISDIMTGIAYLAPPRKTNYECVNDPDRLIEVVDHILRLYDSGGIKFGFIAIDTESTNIITEKVSPVPYPTKHNIGSIQICWNPGEAIAIPIIRSDSVFNNEFNIVVLRNQLARILSRIPVVGQNYKFDESYFNVKLGLKTEHFVFDTMLGHHFMHGGSLPTNLGFMTSRILGWPSHKRDIEAELDAMPEEVRSYSRLSVNTLLNYGCRDADCTLHIAHHLIEKMKQTTYENFGVPVVYSNMYEAFMARVMFPWRAILDIEERGAPIDVDKMPEVSADLERRMNDAYAVIYESAPHAAWLIDHTVPNPKRRTYVKKASYYYQCDKCSHTEQLGDSTKRPKGLKCSKCSSDVKSRWKMVNTDQFTLNDSEPETITTPINLRSPKQVGEFFYSPKYLGFPHNEDLEGSTDKAARAFYLDYSEKRGLEVHARILLAVAEYNKASKLYTAYATKLPNYLFLQSEETARSTEVTSRFEVNTGINHVHTNYFQDGTVSGRLSTRDPSLHTIPRKSTIKKLFISRFGKYGLVLQNDLSQAEVRAFVIETGDDSLRDAFIAGVDPYIKMASNTYSVPLEKVTDDMRQDNKSIVLGLLFGRGATAISEQIKKDVNTVRGIISNFFGGMPKLKRWIDSQHRFVERWKCAVSRFGRIRPLVDQIDADDDEMLNHARNISVNHPIQGMVGDLCIDSVARIEYAMRSRGLKSVIFNTVHDSTIVDLYIPEILQVMPLIREEMFTKLPEYFPWITVPFAIDQELGLSWGQSVKASVKDNILTISGDPGTLHQIMLRIKNSWGVKVVSAEPKTGKDGSITMTFKGELVA